jgi:hypothetical protein
MFNMTNLFNFDYEQENISNKDGSASRFGVVYGANQKVIHVKKDSYSIIPTADLSTIGNAFVEKGYGVSTFSHRDGEVIGLNINLGERPSAVGDKLYQALITVPNNGVGKGFLSIKEVRLVCTNGMVRSLSSDKSQIKIPHSVDYPYAIKLMQDSLEQFELIISSISAREEELDSQAIDKDTAMYELNKWFFNHEMPDNHKEGLTLNTFRELVATNPDSIKCIERHNELRAAFNKELGFNEELGLKLSMYTVFATVTNYLSRRIEKSASAAPVEIQYQRQAEKLAAFI